MPFIPASGTQVLNYLDCKLCLGEEEVSADFSCVYLVILSTYVSNIYSSLYKALCTDIFLRRTFSIVWFQTNLSND